jgi:serine/threonine protein kinase
VYSGQDKATGERVAVKVIAKKTLTKAKIAEVRREGRVMRELQALPHPNLICLKDGFEDRRNIYIIMELYVVRRDARAALH